jgi:hypothetical protein
MTGRIKLLLALALAALAAWPLAAAAATPSEIASLTQKALSEKSFVADITVKIDNETVAAQGKLNRKPPELVRLEHYKGTKLTDYYIEGSGPSVEIMPAEKRGIIVSGRRINLLFELVAYSLDSSSKQGTLKVANATSSGRKMFVITGGAGKATFKLVVDCADYLPREFTASRSQGSGLAVQLKGLKVVPSSQFSAAFFNVPKGYRVSGRAPRLGASDRQRLLNFQGRLSGAVYDSQSSRQTAKAAEAGGGASDNVFLPILPTRFPPGFVIDSVTPLYFSDNLLYHIELVEPGQLQLVSIFETQHESLLDDFRKSRKQSKGNFLDREYDDSGIFVIIISDDVSQAQLTAIFDSLAHQPQVALGLINRALARLLSE